MGWWCHALSGFQVARVNIRQQQKNEANELWELNRRPCQDFEPSSYSRPRPLGPRCAMSGLVKPSGWWPLIFLARLGAMGLAERKEVNLDFSKDDEEKRVAVVTRETTPPFLDGRKVFTTQTEAVSLAAGLWETTIYIYIHTQYSQYIQYNNKIKV